MMNMPLIERAVKLAADCFEMENIAMTNDCIRKRVIDWYNHTDISDAYELATAAWLGDYDSNVNYDSIQETTQYLFTPEVVERYERGHYHIGEIEEAMNDANWQ